MLFDILWHVTPNKLSKNILTPHIPRNYMTERGFENNTTARVCLAPYIQHALRGRNQQGYLYVYYVRTDEVKTLYYPTIDEVPDVKLTHEIWCPDPIVYCDLYGKIDCNNIKGKFIPFTLRNGEECTVADWEYEFVRDTNNIFYQKGVVK